MTSIVRPALVYVALFFSVGAYFPYISVFYRSIGLSLEAIGLLAALNAACGLVAAPAWGALADQRRDLRGPLVLAGAWSAAAAAWLAVARDPLQITAAVALLALGAAGLGPLLDSRTIELLGDRPDRFGVARAWGSAAFVVASLLVGLLIEQTTAAAALLVMAPGLVVTSVAAYLLLGAGSGRRRVTISPWAGLLGILRDPTLSIFLLGSVVLWSSVSAVTTFISVHMVAIGVPGGVIGLVWALGAAVEVPLMLAFPRMSRRFGAERLLVLGALAFALRAAGWALADEPWMLVLVAPLGGVGFALFYVGTVGYVAGAVPRGVQATAQGVFSGTAFSTGSILGALIGGVLAGHVGLPWLFAIASAGCIAAAAIVWLAIAGGTRAVRPGTTNLGTN